jgi:hypothetical protein
MAAAADKLVSGAPLLDEAEDISQKHVAGKLYPTRWWILFVFSMFTFVQVLVSVLALGCRYLPEIYALLQCWQWAMTGPIAGPYEAAYGIDGTQIQLLVNYGEPVCAITIALHDELTCALQGQYGNSCAVNSE